MNICVTLNSRFCQYLCVMLESLFCSNENERIVLFVLQNDFTDKDKAMITELVSRHDQSVEIIDMDNKISGFDRHTIEIIQKRHFMEMIVSRLTLPELLTTCDRVLLLDIDLLVNKNLSELYNIDFEDKYLAMAPSMCFNFIVPEESRKWYPKDRKNWKHYNCGVSLWNLDKIREDFEPFYIINSALKAGIERSNYEEEALNVIFGENGVLELDASKWNYSINDVETFGKPEFYTYSSDEDAKAKCHVFHFMGQNNKPWQVDANHAFSKIWWEYAKRFHFCLDMMSECFFDSLDRLDGLSNEFHLVERRFQSIDKIIDRENGEKISLYFKNCGTKRIAIYGASRVCRCLIYLLDDIGLQVSVIDKYRTGLFCNKVIISTEEVDNGVADLIIVSLVNGFEGVKNELANQTSARIISLDELFAESGSGD